MNKSRATLLLIILIDGLGIGIVYPTFAYYFLEANSLLFSTDISEKWRTFYLGLTFAIYPFFMAIGSLKIGQLSDRLGRKKALLLCLAGFSFGFFLTSLGVIYNLLWLIIISRALAGLTAGCHVIAQASMADISLSTHSKAKNMGAVVMASTLGFVIGPGLGGILSSAEILPFFTVATPFIVVMSMGICAFFLVQFFFKETFSQSTFSAPESFQMQDLQLLTQPFIVRLALIYFLFTVGWNFFFQFAPVYLENFFFVDATMTGAFMSFVALVFMAAIAIIVQPLLRHIRLTTGLLLGLLLLTLSIVIVLNVSAFFWFWVAVIPLCIGGGLTYTVCLSLFSDAATKLQQGHMMGIASMIKSIAWTLAPLISGFIAYFNLQWPMMGAAICFVLGAMISVRLKRDTA